MIFIPQALILSPRKYNCKIFFPHVETFQQMYFASAKDYKKCQQPSGGNAIARMKLYSFDATPFLHVRLGHSAFQSSKLWREEISCSSSLPLITPLQYKFYVIFKN